MLGAVAERTMVGLDNVAKVGQAHSAKLLRDTLEDLKLDESDLELHKEEEEEEEEEAPATPATETKAE
ncbi:coil containing protein, partial [Vibrio phage 1.097.O._10N.286.49.B3]